MAKTPSQEAAAAAARKGLAMPTSKLMEPSRPSSKRLHEQAGEKVKEVAYSTKAGTLRFLGRFQPKAGAQSVLAENEVLRLHDSQVSNPIIPVEAKIENSANLALNMYKQAFGADEPYLGQYYCSYGSAGYELALEAGFDFGALLMSVVAPPLGIELTVKPSLGGNFAKVKHLLLTIQKAFPRRIPRAPISWGGIPDVSPLPLLNPFCFMALFGGEKGGGVTLKAEVSASVAPPVNLNIDGHDLSLNLFTTEASVSGRCKFIHMEDQLPGWYRTVLDHELEEDTYRLASPSKRELIRRVNAFQESLRKKMSGIRFAQFHPAIIESIEKLQELVNTSLFSRQLRSSKPSAVKVQEWIDDIKDPIQGLNHDGLIFTDEDNAEIQKYFKEIRDAITDATAAMVPQEAAKAQLPLKKHLDLLSTDQINALKSKNCYTHIAVYGLEGAASATAGGSKSQEFNLGMLTQLPGAENLGGEGSLEVQAQTNINGNLRFMSSRYQTFVNPGQGRDLIFTQDTKITYTQVVWDASATAAANLPFDYSMERGKSIEKVFKNDMNYYSATAYWRGSTAGATADLLPGSGIAVGISMSTAKLQDLIQQIHDPSFDKKAKKYPQHLSLTHSEFKAFLSMIPKDTFTPDFIAETPYVLLEAAFKFNSQQQVQVDNKGQLESLSKKFFRGGDQQTFVYRKAGLTVLDSIRCRIRQGEDVDNSRSVFKLGIQIPGPEIEVDISRIERAGNMFVEDVFVYVPDPSIIGIQTDTPPVATSTPIPSPSKKSRQTMDSPPPAPPDRTAEMPPVILLPHTFQID